MINKIKSLFTTDVLDNLKAICLLPSGMVTDIIVNQTLAKQGARSAIDAPEYEEYCYNNELVPYAGNVRTWVAAQSYTKYLKKGLCNGSYK